MKEQGYKDRRDESMGMKRKMDEMGHANKVMKCDSFAAQRSDMNRLRNLPWNNKGQPQQAWDYKY